MSRREIDATIGAADPVDRPGLDALDLEAAERELIAGIVAEPREDPDAATPRSAARPRRWGDARGPRRRRLALGGAVVATAALVLIVSGIGFGPAAPPAPARGADLARLANSSPHVLLEADGWRLHGALRSSPSRGAMWFVHGDGTPVSYLAGHVKITRWSVAALAWHSQPPGAPRRPGPDATFVDTAKALGVATRVYSRPLSVWPGHQFIAVWDRAGRRLELRTNAPSLDAFERRLGALRLVGRAAWLDALPGHVVRRVGSILAGEPAEGTIVAKCAGPLPPGATAGESRALVALYERECEPTTAVLSGVSLSRNRVRLDGSHGAPADAPELRLSSTEVGILVVKVWRRGAGKPLTRLVRRIEAGQSAIGLSTLIGHSRLLPGHYTLSAIVSRPPGNVSKPVRLGFTVLPG